MFRIVVSGIASEQHNETNAYPKETIHFNSAAVFFDDVSMELPAISRVKLPKVAFAPCAVLVSEEVIG